MDVILTDKLISLAARAGYTPNRDDAGSLTLANTGGEIRYTVSPHQGGYFLSSAERAEEPESLMWAAELRYVEVMLARLLAVALRSREGMGPVRLPFGWEEAADGFEANDSGDGWTGLARGGSPLALKVADRNPLHPVIQLSYLLVGSFDEVLVSLSSADGAPPPHPVHPTAPPVMARPRADREFPRIPLLSGSQSPCRAGCSALPGGTLHENFLDTFKVGEKWQDDVMPISRYQYESEILFQRGTEFEVVSKFQDADGVWRIHLRELPVPGAS